MSTVGLLGYEIMERPTKLTIGFTFVAVLCATTFLSLIIFTPPYTIDVNKLLSKPDQYVALTNPDPILSKAISTLKPVHFYSFDETQFDELTGGSGGIIVEYQNEDYTINYLGVTSGALTIIIWWATFIGLIVSTTLLVILIIGKVWRQRKRKNQATYIFE